MDFDQLVNSSYLSLQGVQPATLIRYSKLLYRFLSFARKLDSPLKKKKQVDKCFQNYIEQCYQQDAKFYPQIEMTLSAILFFYPHLRNSLFYSLKSIKGWHSIYETNYYTRRIPIPWEATLLISLTMARNGYIPHAVLTVLSFHCYLRISEGLNLAIDDFYYPNHPSLGSVSTHYGISIRKAKRDKNISIPINVTPISDIMRYYVEHYVRSDDDYLFPITYSNYFHIFKYTCSKLSLSPGYVPHGLRHGGATFDFIQHVPLTDIKVRGRWQRDATLLNYMNQAQSVMLPNQIPQKWIHIISKYHESYHTVIIQYMQRFGVKQL
jgi:integrase